MTGEPAKESLCRFWDLRFRLAKKNGLRASGASGISGN